MWLEKTGLECWAYSYISQNILLPLSRREDFTYYGGSLRACKGCQHRDHTGCIEPRAESAADPETANFCDCFFIGTTGFNQKAKPAQENTRQQLDLLFQDSKTAEVFGGRLDNGKSQAEKPREQSKGLFNP